MMKPLPLETFASNRMNSLQEMRLRACSGVVRYDSHSSHSATEANLVTMKPRPTIEEIRSTYSYDPETGFITFIRKTTQRIKIGSRAGTENARGYWVLSYRGKEIPAAHVAWVITHGAWPTKFIDHINGVKSDNRLKNLREATFSQNRMNVPKYASNSSGYRGVFWHKASSKWSAGIQVNGRSRHLGLFLDPQEAHEAYKAAANQLHGEFAHH